MSSDILIDLSGTNKNSPLKNLRFGGTVHKICMIYQVFFKESVRYLVWTCSDPIFPILETRFSPFLEA